MDKPYLSIIIACYNAESYLECAIRSVLDQPFNNIELIIINDGSKDATNSICEKYCLLDNRIQYYSTENLGAGHARNYGLSKASGTWVSYLDSDDLYLSGAIDHKMIGRLRSYESEHIDIVFTPWCRADMMLCEHITLTQAKSDIGVIPELAFWTCLYCRDFLVKNEINFYEYREQDVETAFRYLAASKTKKTIVDNEIRFYLQRENKNSNTNTWNVQILHATKCQIYYDLFINHSTPEAYWHLIDTFIEEMFYYYDSCMDMGILNLETLKKINVIRNELFTKYRKIVLLSLGRRKCMELFLKGALVNSICKYKHSTKYEKNVRNKVRMDPDIILARLKAVSQFLLLENEGENL